MKKPTSHKSIIKVKIIPRSSQNLIVGQEADTWRIKLTSPPVDGKANTALLNFLSKKLGLSKRAVEVVSGRHSRIKYVQIEDLSREAASKILKGLQ